jgi:hypothetical protein
MKVGEMSERAGKVVFRRPAYVRCEGWVPAQKALQTAAKVLRSEQRAEKLLLSAMLDRTLQASIRGVMDDYDIYPVPKEIPAKKTDLIKALWFSNEGEFFSLDAFGSLSGSLFDEVEMDFVLSRLVAFRHPESSAFIDPEDGEVTVRPRSRRVHFDVEISEASLTRLLAPYGKKSSSEARARDANPDSDEYRVNLTASQWREVLLPLITLAQSGRLEDKFGRLGYGDKRLIRDEILRLLEDRKMSASPSTLLRKCNSLLAMNEQARSALQIDPDGSN